MATDRFALSEQELETLLTSAAFAPSGGNIQPWRVVAKAGSAGRTGPDRLEIHLDKTRSTSFLDAGRYASVMALGSFTENLSIAADALGLAHKINLPEYRGIDGPVALVVFKRRRKAAPGRNPLYPWIGTRVTNRKLGDGSAVSEKDLGALGRAASSERGACRLAARGEAADREEIARILGKADVVRMFNPTLHRQMFEEVRWTAEEAERTKDGIDVATLEMPPEAIGQMGALRSFDVVKQVPPQAIEGMAQPPLVGCSHVCLLVLKKPLKPQNLFAAGRALGRVWLHATRLGLSVQPWTVLPFFLIRVDQFGGEGFSLDEQQTLRQLGRDLRAAFGVKERETPMFAFRLFRAGPPTVRSLRLPWRAFTRVEA